MFAPGAIDDFSTANPLHFQLVNLQAALFDPAKPSPYSGRGRGGIRPAAAFWFRAVRRDGQIGLLDLAILTSAALLPVYHRFTDAGLLAVPVAWALSEMEGELRRFALGCLLLASPFLIPGATMLQEFSGRSEILQTLSRGRLWNWSILSHESWLILIICVVLLAARSLSRGHKPGQPRREPQPSIAS